MKKQALTVLMVTVVASCTGIDVSKYKNNPEMPIVVSNYYQSSPTPTGAVEFEFIGYNNTDKTIKYIYFNVIHRNRVHDIVYDDISGREVKSYMFVGPFSREEKFYRKFGPHFYNQSAICIELKDIRIEYIDGTAIDLKDEKLSKTFAFSGGSCRNVAQHKK